MDLFSLPIVAIALSVIISWALFAIFCSIIQETLVQIKGERGRFFKRYVLQQLADAPNRINWGSLLYTNSSVDLLSREYNKPASGITPKIFSEALIETVANSHLVQSAKLSETEYSAKYQSKLLSDFAHGTTILLPSSTIAFLKNALTKAEIRAGGDGRSNFSEEKLYNCLVEEISDWYQQFCERSSIWYAKATKTRLFFLGLIIALLLNVDSIRLFNYFNSNPNARAAMIAYYQQNAVQLENLAQKYEAGPGANPVAAAELKKDRDDFKNETEKLIADNQLPVGWKTNLFQRGQGNDWQSVFFKILGYAISAFAASVGAPFWFDILKKANPIKTKTP